MWWNIIKMPIVEELDNDDRFDRFLGNPDIFTQQASSHLYQWKSEDEDARAKYSLLIVDVPVWYIDVFEIAKDSRGQGKSREYLKELVADIREEESNLDIDEIKRVNRDSFKVEGKWWWTLYENQKEERQNWNSKYDEIFNTPYKIVGKHLPDTKEFWDKMIEEKIVDEYL